MAGETLLAVSILAATRPATHQSTYDETCRLFAAMDKLLKFHGKNNNNNK